ncbi:MAG: NifB/NifX family molybdenum-iron cluster-binding protein [Candidatus Scalindua sp.]|jgi:predicted Fe-Mo cluster-binding NifX family protein|nr:NifB/NifX family molybdenum-iron cluster-binding protein [Candidatus Scalindua sp.]
MKLCITSTGKDMDSRVDERFGRAPYFQLFDTDTMDVDTISNTAQFEKRGAGVRAAQIILDKGTGAVLTGSIGPNAFTALNTANVKIYEGTSGSDTVREVVERFKKGEYKETSTPARGHGGGFRGGK